MGKAEAGSLKAMSNAMKAKGLTKLRFYCQICSKACRDQNGYRNHIESEAHMRQMDVLTSSGNVKRAIDDFSSTFQKEYVQLLSRRFGTRRVRANQVYQEHIADRHHVHLNATQWSSLSDFVKHLGREGIAQVEDTDQGWFLTWIDNSPAALARQDALQKLDRAKTDDEQRQRKLLQEQIDKASAKSASSEIATKMDEGLKRDGAAPVRIGLTPSSAAHKPLSSNTPQSTPAAALPATEPSASKPPPFKMGFNVLKSNPSATRSNPFNTPSDPAKKSKPPSSMTMAEKIMHEELERKKRKTDTRVSGPQMQSGIKRSRF